MKKEASAPTMKDVAREAGVALGTVSKVVNGLPVGDSYKLRVEDAIRKLNYQVNSYAQGLKANKTYTVAVLIPNTVEPFFAALAHHINIVLTRQKYRMLLCCTGSDSAQEQEYVTMAQQNKVDGIIGLTYNPNLVIEENTPFVAIDRSIGTGIPCVASDNFAGGSSQPKNWRISAAKMSLSCGSVPPCPTNPTNGKPALRTDASPAACIMR